MATPDPEDEIKVLKETNTELVKKVQHWMMLAAQRENEKLDLLKELNEMRLKLARLRNNGDIQASKLDTALQSASEKALAHLVRASGEIARTIDLAKAYMRERIEVDTVSPRWSAIGGTPKTEKVHRVPPMMIGGQSIQPVVSLSRTMLNTSNPRPAARSPNQNINVTERAMPMHMLQDVYIPLTRIDVEELQANNMGTEVEANDSDSTEELGLDGSGERSELDESQRLSGDEYNNSLRRMDAVVEDVEPEEVETPPRNSRSENPLEGPSWLLDVPSTSSKSASQSGRNLEPDSTTEVEVVTPCSTPGNTDTRSVGPRSSKVCSPRVSCEFSPTVRRRRKRTSSPPPVTPRRLSQYSPRPVHSRRNSNSGRVLKVVVAKMRLESAWGSPAPCKRPALGPELLHSPSPNGATVAGVIVSESTQDSLDHGAMGEPLGTCRRESSQSQERRRQREETRPQREEIRPQREEVRPQREEIRPQREEVRQQREEIRQQREEIQPQEEEGRAGRGARRRRQRASDDTRDSADESGRDADAPGVKEERDSRDNTSRRQDISSRYGSRDSRDSDSGSGTDAGGGAGGGGRSRRARNKVVSYQEKPLNRKMRR